MTKTQQETLQELSDEWKHRNDQPERSAKTGRGRRGKSTAKAEDPTASAAADEPKKEDAETA